MGRVFTIMFEFGNERHAAVVKICNQGSEGPVYYVRLFNPELQKIIPGGRIRFTSADQTQSVSLQQPYAEELFFSVKEAVFMYLREDPMDKEVTDEVKLNRVHYDEHRNTSMH